MLKKLLVVTFIFCQYVINSQEHAWVYFTDKENVAYSLANPLTILTQRAIDRKIRHGVVIDDRDVPLNENYKFQVESSEGIQVKAKSKWFNAVHVIGSEVNINALTNLPFVSFVVFADQSLNMSPLQNNQSTSKFEIEETMVNFNYGNTQNQVEMINAHRLHELDYTGSGVLIAVLDSGFPNVDTMNSFQRLRDAGNLLDGYDFVNRTDNIYLYTGSNHGTKVLSTMAGFIEDQFVGTAPDASYYLFRTEEAEQETPVEESFWVEATERADSLGVDIINTSLGYKGYDNPNYSHSSTDLDGNTAFITKGANIAHEKGLLLVNSAGNSGSAGVNAPADAAGVFSIGAVDSEGIYATFSSRGSSVQPTHKPDVVAQGKLTYVIGPDDIITQNNGTSFSSPIIAGGLACLIQAIPDLSNEQIMQLVRESGSQYALPDYFLGFGIPNLETVLAEVLSNHSMEHSEFLIFPNPVETFLHLKFPANIDIAQFSVYDALGNLVLDKTIKQFDRINLEVLSSGIYILMVNVKGINLLSTKVIKI